MAVKILPAAIKEPDLGVPFQEAYDMDTLRPTHGWAAAYGKVTAECIELGIPQMPADARTHGRMEMNQR